MSDERIRRLERAAAAGDAEAEARLEVERARADQRELAWIRNLYGPGTSRTAHLWQIAGIDPRPRMVCGSRYMSLAGLRIELEEDAELDLRPCKNCLRRLRQENVRRTALSVRQVRQGGRS